MEAIDYGRLERVESATDPRVKVDLDAIDRELSRVEAKILRVGKRRSSWTSVGSFSAVLEAGA